MHAAQARLAGLLATGPRSRGSPTTTPGNALVNRVQHRDVAAGPRPATPSSGGSASTPRQFLPTPRYRRRRTLDPDQLALGLAGNATHAYAVSFIVTKHPHPRPAQPREQAQTVRDVEAWFRRRTDIEERIHEAKPGTGLRHLPSAHTALNAVWMWAALLAGNLSVLLQALTGIDEHGHAHAPRPPAAPRTLVHSSPAGPPWPAPDPATTTCRPPRAAQRSHQDPRTRQRGLKPLSQPADQDSRNNATPGGPGHTVVPDTTVRHRNTPQPGSRSDRGQYSKLYSRIRVRQASVSAAAPSVLLRTCLETRSGGSPRRSQTKQLASRSRPRRFASGSINSNRAVSRGPIMLTPSHVKRPDKDRPGRSGWSRMLWAPSLRSIAIYQGPVQTRAQARLCWTAGQLTRQRKCCVQQGMPDVETPTSERLGGLAAPVAAPVSAVHTRQGHRAQRAAERVDEEGDCPRLGRYGAVEHLDGVRE